MTAESFFGIEIDRDGTAMMASASDIASYSAGEAGYRAIEDRIRESGPHAHVCIRSCAATVPLAQQLTSVRGIQVTLVPSLVINPSASAKETAGYLARLATELA